MTLRSFSLLALTLALACGPAVAAEPPSRSASAASGAHSLQASADGSELVDTASGLVWQRCVQGMQWDGRHCTGEPALATHAEALALARAHSTADGRLWRVPRVPELKRLADRLTHDPQAAALVSGAPGGWYWSSSVRVESEAVNPYNYANVQRGATERQVNRLNPQQGWAVQLPAGAVRGDMAKRERLPVRLVRALQP
jgi:hypothetical protein